MYSADQLSRQKTREDKPISPNINVKNMLRTS